MVLGFTALLAGGILQFASVGGQDRAKIEWEASTAGVPAADELTRLSFPAQGATFYVWDGASKKNLLLGPVHILQSATPGQSGNCIIAAHRDTHFRMLKDVKREDQIVLERAGRTYRYRITALHIVRAGDSRFYRATISPVLTLVTCYPFSYLGSAPKRFIVRAELLAPGT